MTLRTKTLTAVAALTIFAGGYALAQDAATTEQPAEAQQPAADAGTSTATPVEDTQPETGATEGEAAEEPATDADEAGAGEPEAEAAPAEAEAAESEPAEEPAEAATEEPAAEAAPAEAEATEAEPADAAEAEEPASDAAATTEEAPAEAETADDAAEEAPADAEATEGEPADAAAEEPAADAVTTEEAPAEAEATEGETAEEPADAATDEPAADEATAEEAPAEEGAADEAATELEAPGEEEEAAGEHGGHIEDISFSFEGPFGKYDQFQLQRGLQVYTEVCAACHGLKFVPLRTLSDDGGPGLPEDQVRAYAAEMTIIDKETGEERPRLPTDHFPENTGVGAPDLSLMAKARAGFHGPYGTGVNQLVKGIGGPEYIHALLTGYTGEEQEQAGTILYENTAFASGYISMTPPLSDDLVTYEDGTPATVDQMARDVSAFLMWTAEPKLSARKQVGLVSVLFLTLLTALLYLTNKRLWAPHKGKNQAH